MVENWNSANHDLFYGKDGDLTGADKESQEVSMLALHLLQSALVHVNTLLMQQVLAEPKWSDRLTEADRRALSALFWTHVNPYGWFELDMNPHLDLGSGPTVPGQRRDQEQAVTANWCPGQWQGELSRCHLIGVRSVGWRFPDSVWLRPGPALDASDQPSPSHGAFRPTPRYAGSAPCDDRRAPTPRCGSP
ncbi:hypothetical protein GCM10010339_88300 [Streptomyces alanosinicus]|uniref:Tn3 transposase DDE domain-containing protein n=1 Tax=Streptomyces alanosinicus TaxID=68171 RepID=A0A918YV85_9ACTN|nr:hypothetical protein GCM10010339_88300 [Streptomyces alanosinicus]